MGCCASKRPRFNAPDVGLQGFVREAVDCASGLVVRAVVSKDLALRANRCCLQVRASAAGYLTKTLLDQQLAVYTGEDVTLLALVGSGGCEEASPADVVTVLLCLARYFHQPVGG